MLGAFSKSVAHQVIKERAVLSVLETSLATEQSQVPKPPARVIASVGASIVIISPSRDAFAVKREHFIDIANPEHFSVLQQECFVAKLTDHGFVVRGKDENLAAAHEVLQAFFSFVHECGIAGANNLIHQQDIGIHVGNRCKR